MSESWYFQVNGVVSLPLTPQQLKQQADAGIVKRETLVRKGASGKWVEAWHVKGLITLPPKVERKLDSEEDNAMAYLTADAPSVPQPPPIPAAPVEPVYVPAIPIPGIRREVPTATTKACPFCGEEILIVAIKCKHCGEALDGSTPRKATQTRKKKQSTLLLVRSAIAVTGLVVGAAIYILSGFVGRKTTEEKARTDLKPVVTAQPPNDVNQQILEELKKQNETWRHKMAEEERVRKESEAAEVQKASKDLLLKQWARALAKKRDEQERKLFNIAAFSDAMMNNTLMRTYESHEEEFYEAYLAALRKQLETANQEELVKKARELGLPMQVPKNSS